jgi:uncharacterized phage-associated protein
MYKAKEVAGYIVYTALHKGLHIDNIQLQKILYYTQGTFIVHQNRKLFQDKIMKWKLGPVIPEIHKEYAIFGSGPIGFIPGELTFDPDNWSTYYKNFSPSIIKEEDGKVIRDITSVLLTYRAYELVDLTHTHDSWKKHIDLINTGRKDIEYDLDELKFYLTCNPDRLHLQPKED